MSPCGLGGNSSSIETTEAVSDTGWCAGMYVGGSGQTRSFSFSLVLAPHIRNTPENVSKAPTRKTMHWAADLSAKSLKTTIEHSRTAVVKKTKWIGTTVVALAILRQEFK
ncbi:hypothetical protein KL918_002023 [Ogataea parapolymorpha]|nr:hypothetical protein KL918_002023 [Ogataea parapolymorpha]KAG7871411.1 hypothetical protein KL916_003991 [Ogataea parapolymorpha]